MLLGLGFALFSSPNTNAVMGSVETRFYGVASATLATMRMTGQMLSMGIAMLVFAVRIGDGPDHARAPRGVLDEPQDRLYHLLDTERGGRLRLPRAGQRPDNVTEREAWSPAEMYEAIGSGGHA